MKKYLKQLKEDVFKLKEDAQNIEAQSVKTMQSLFDATHKLCIIKKYFVFEQKLLIKNSSATNE